MPSEGYTLRRIPGGLHVVFGRTVTAEDVLAANRAVVSDPGFSGDGCAIWDYGATEQLDFMNADLRALAQADRQHAERTPGRRIAIVVANPLQQALAGLYTEELAGGPWRVRVFDDLAGAATWLGLRPRP